MNKHCSICLKDGNFPVLIAGICSPNNEPASECTTMYKLQLCVPEINWHSDQNVCSSCIEALDKAYYFKQKCLGSEVIRRSNNINQKCTLDLNVKQEQQNVSFNFNIDNNSAASSVSIGSSQDWVDHVILKDHNHQVHATESVDGTLEQVGQLLQLRNKTVKKIVYFCEICSNNFFKSPESLQNHRVRKHIPSSCKLCGSNFKNGAKLNNHFLKVHSNVQCDLCGTNFKKSRLKRHMKKCKRRI